MQCATELKGVTFNIKLQFIQIMGRYDRCSNIGQASVTDQKLCDRDLHLLHLNTSHILDHVEGICASSRVSHLQYTPSSTSQPLQPTRQTRQQNLGKIQKARVLLS